MESTQNDISFWSKNASEIEAFIISGQHQECRKILESINPKTLPPEWAGRFAELGIRVHIPIFALKALHRYIAPEKPQDRQATNAEKMTYAYALCLLGATQEALDLLNTISVEQEPEAYFHKALTNFRLWNYAESVPLLKDFLRSTSADSYRHLVGQVNLVAALIATAEWGEALSLVEKVQTVCREQNYTLLLGNSFELQAQIFFFQRKYQEALTCLAQARSLLQDQKGLYLLFVEKWTLLCELFQTRSPEKLEQLHALRREAQLLDNYETVRECDLFEAICTQNEDLLRKVIMGTPSEYYRQRARQLFGKALSHRGYYTWDLSPADLEKSEAKPFTFDPYEKQNGQAALYDKPYLLAIFDALTADFYRPNHLGILFKKVYPEEKFNPYTSPPRVMRLLKRLDQWLEEHQIPIRVEFKKSEFRLIAARPAGVLIQRGQKVSSEEGHWSEMKEKFNGRTMTTAKIADALGISKTSARRLLNQGLAEGRIVSAGQGRGTLYHFSSRKKIKAAA